MGTVHKKKAQQIRRKKRVRKKIFGTSDRPRMSVFRSAKHIYVQVIDDNKGATLAIGPNAARCERISGTS